MNAVDRPRPAVRDPLRALPQRHPRPNFAFVIGTGRWNSHGFEGPNTWVLYAIDSAGNRSAPSDSVTRELSGDDCQ
jgi:hypothetical protein